MAGFPLTLAEPTQRAMDKTPMATSSQADLYNSMVGGSVASEDVGLFAQLNGSALSAQELLDAATDNRGPIEANSSMA